MQNVQQAAYKRADDLIGYGDIELAEVLLVHKPIAGTERWYEINEEHLKTFPELTYCAGKELVMKNTFRKRGSHGFRDQRSRYRVSKV